MRALPADSLEYLGETAEGNVALPIATGAGVAAGLADVVAFGGGAAGAGSLAASAPHCAFRKSFHFMPFWASVPSEGRNQRASACSNVPHGHDWLPRWVDYSDNHKGDVQTNPVI